MSGTTVIGVGCELDRLFHGQPPALPMPGPPGRDDLRDLYDAISAPVRHGEAVVVIVGEWLPEDTLRSIRTVRSLLQSDRVALYVSELPPLATSVLGALAAALAPLAPSPGALATGLDAVGAQLYVLAWAGSVAGLQHPSVSLLKHARSLLPGTAFAIGLQPESFVEPISRAGSELPLYPAPHPTELLLAPGERGDVSWMLEVAAPALGRVPVREIPAMLHGAHWWGTSRLVEAVGVPSDLEELATAVFSGPLGRCKWCEELIYAAPCPFCRESLEPRAAGREAAEFSPDTLIGAKEVPEDGT